MIKSAPFRSEKQRRYLWKFHPEIAEKWTKEHGSKPVGKKKKKSAIDKIRLILAADPAPGPNPVTTQPQAAVSQPTNQPGLAQTQEQQYANIDATAAQSLIPQIMQQINSTKLSDVKNNLINNMKVNPKIAEQAANAYAVKIFKEEQAKRIQQVVTEVGQKLGIDPSKIPNMSAPVQMPALPGQQARNQRKIRLASIVQADIDTKIDLSPMIEKVKNMSMQEKLGNLYKFITHFSSVEEAVKALFNFMNNLKTIISQQETPEVTTAALSDKFTMVSYFLFIISMFAACNWIGAADVVDKSMAHHIKVLEADKAAEAMSAIVALSSFGLSAVADALARFLRKREQNKNKKS